MDVDKKLSSSIPKQTKHLDFMSYFKQTWVNSINCAWYEGAAEKIPSTHNGLESNNRTIKDVYTLRERLAPFKKEYKISYDILISETSILQNNGDDFVLTTKDKSKFIKKKFIYGDYYSFKNVDFDTAVCFMSVAVVSLNRKDWVDSKCTCGHFLKNYICFHLIAVAAQQNIIEITLKYKRVPLSQKKKIGRPPKAKKAYIKQ
ncbi:unnamed protein product [Brachionus calyciflorus]|uniref:SWIM-type domain-containing protein n=1 Tax=Brachionus calyciflorus TaxID=104777 RepID=A0A813MAQ3_9BILA|nr:unnamed protein product [Brachionus calyciflorus]